MAVSISAVDRIDKIRDGLLEWFSENARELPWRQTRDPYAILVSEVMLQQTQVDRVVPYYRAFLERFPTLAALAAAPTSEVIRIWSGLGYNRRAVNLQRAAKFVAEELNGKFPAETDQLRKLPGVGPYTAGAISAFAFERDATFLDTNIRRVISRLMFGDRSASDREILAVADSLLPTGKSWEWNQALIEFGALQCTARNPACIVCPLWDVCLAGPTMQTVLANRRGRRGRNQAEPFESTSRYYRGRIVEELRALPRGDARGVDLYELGPRVREDFSPGDLPWLHDLVNGLQRDGLAVICEDSAPYDVSDSPETGTGRVRLP